MLVLAWHGPGSRAQPSFQKGIAYVSWQSDGYSHPDADLSLQNLASTGANWISLLVTQYQETISSTTIHATPSTPTDADLIHAVAQAHSLGLSVMLKPHVDVPNQWRGRIGQDFASEAEWTAWFASYRTFIEHYADLAQSYGVDQFCVGTELSATTHREDDWRALIAAVRTYFDGPLVYAAHSGDEEHSLTWWDAVDCIGVDGYYVLTDKNDPTLAELEAAWVPYVADLADLAATWGRPIVMTEIGYRSLDGANRWPLQGANEASLDLQEQADCYEAAFRSLMHQPWLAGIFWWSWDTDPFQGGPCDDGLSPHDKPSEDVLWTWYRGAPRPKSPPVGPDYGEMMDVYGDGLGSGWEDWSWDATLDLAATDQVHGGTQAISVTLGAWGALSFWHPAFDTEPFYWLEFYIRGSSSVAPELWAVVYDAEGMSLRKRPLEDCRYVEEGTIDNGTWRRVRIPLSHLDATDQSVARFALQERRGRASTSFWVDDIRLVAGRTWHSFLPTMLHHE
jgi:hypothetical protein